VVKPRLSTSLRHLEAREGKNNSQGRHCGLRVQSAVESVPRRHPSVCSWADPSRMTSFNSIVAEYRYDSHKKKSAQNLSSARQAGTPRLRKRANDKGQNPGPIVRTLEIVEPILETPTPAVPLGTAAERHVPQLEVVVPWRWRPIHLVVLVCLGPDLPLLLVIVRLQPRRH